MIKMNKRYRTEMHDYQRGVALITGLIFLVVLTLISITAARMAGLEETTKATSWNLVCCYPTKAVCMVM